MSEAPVHRPLDLIQTLVAMMDGCGEGMLVVDEGSGKVVEAYGEARRLLGTSADGSLRLPAGVPLAPFGPREVVGGNGARKEGEEALTLEVSAHRMMRDGTPLLLVRLRDVGDRVALREKAVREAQLQAELIQAEKLATVGTLFAHIAHDLNNPLSILMGYADLALGEPGCPEPIREHLERLQAAAQRCVKLVCSLLGFARKSSGKLHMGNLCDPIEMVLALRSRQLCLDRIQIRKDFDRTLPPMLIDEQKLSQVLLNLINNAADALRDGDEAGTIGIRTAREGDWAVVSVENNGPPIPDQVLEHIFEPFFTTKPAGYGTGLGLSICKEIMESLGGSIEATYRAGWVVFACKLPLQCPDATDEDDQDKEADFCEEDIRGARILVVDDEPDQLQVVERILGEHGAIVVIARGGKAGLRRLQLSSYDLIVCDLKMPEVDGLAVYRYVEAQRPRMLQRMLISSGDVSDVTREFLEHAKATVLPKPYDARALCQTVASHLRRLGRLTTRFGRDRISLTSSAGASSR